MQAIQGKWHQRCIELANNDRKRLKYFSITALVFFCSYGTIYHANTNIAPSLEQEITALLAIAVCLLSLAFAVGLQIIYILKNTGFLSKASPRFQK